MFELLICLIWRLGKKNFELGESWKCDIFILFFINVCKKGLMLD